MNVNDKLRLIQVEDFVWIIYLIVIGLSFYSNKIEKEFLFTKNEKLKQEYRNLNITIFTIVTLIYLYFTFDSLKAVNNLNSDSTKEEITFTNLALSQLSLS